MTNLPAPLTPAECTMKGVPMPFDGNEFFMRDALSGDAIAMARLRLMWFAWARQPAAAIPNVERVLLRLSMMTKPRWKRDRAEVLRDWVLCSDERIYHPALAAAARLAWQHRMAIKAKGNRINVKSHEWRAIRTMIFTRDEFTCGYCGQRGGKLECDHVVPIARGGSNEPENLVTACYTCNRSKGARLASEWMPS